MPSELPGGGNLGEEVTPGYWRLSAGRARVITTAFTATTDLTTIDQLGQVIEVLVAQKRDRAATRRFFTRVLEHGPSPTEVTTDRVAAYPRVLDELVPAACHITEQYANNAIEADHGRLKSRLRPMRGLKQFCCA